jgi:5-methylcytosine-specific restriction protein A
MPWRPRRPCSWKGCPLLVTSRFCAAHASAYDLIRGTARARGYDQDHEAWRAAVLARDPFCKDPDRRHPLEGVRSTVADHIVPVRADGPWSLENGQGLCASCHSAKTARVDGGFGNARGGGPKSLGDRF